MLFIGSFEIITIRFTTLILSLYCGSSDSVTLDKHKQLNFDLNWKDIGLSFLIGGIFYLPKIAVPPWLTQLKANFV